MSGWWQNLSLREKGLVAGAVGLLLLIIGWYGVLAPSLSARAAAQQARLDAANELSLLERLVALRRVSSPAATGTAVSTSAALDPEAFKAEVTRSAQSAGLSIARLQGSAPGRFGLVFEQADPRQLFYWLNTVETRLGGHIERLSIDQAPEGRVRASVELAAGGG